MKLYQGWIMAISILFACYVSSAASEALTRTEVKEEKGEMELILDDVLAEAKTDESMDIIPGPYPGMEGLRSTDGHQRKRIKLGEAVSKEGYISFWLKIDRSYLSGKNAEEFAQKVIESPGIFLTSIRQRRHEFDIFWRWEESIDNDFMRTILPGFRGPVWCHIAYHWKAEKGIFNGFINGTRLQLEDPKFNKPWEMPPVEEIILHFDKFAFSEVKVGHHLLDKETLKKEISDLYFGSMDMILGARELGRFDVDELKGNMIYENALADNSDVESWVMEGPGETEFEDGWMRMYSPDEIFHHVFWCDKDFPERFIAEWEFRPESFHGLCIVFFAARSMDGRSIFDPALQKRGGRFPAYHSGDIDSYHISYFANTPGRGEGRITSNLRKNHGFYLLTNGPVHISPFSGDKTYKISLMKDDNHIQMAVNGKIIIDFYDDGETYGNVLGSGKIGFRQMQWTVGKYRNFRVWEIK